MVLIVEVIRITYRCVHGRTIVFTGYMQLNEYVGSRWHLSLTKAADAKK